MSGAPKAGVAGVHNKAIYLAERRVGLERWSAHISGLMAGDKTPLSRTQRVGPKRPDNSLCLRAAQRRSNARTPASLASYLRIIGAGRAGDLCTRIAA